MKQIVPFMNVHNMILNLTDRPFYTIQGEGYGLGRPSIFIRFSGCNLRCRWLRNNVESICDTPYSSFKPERHRETLADIVDFIEKHSKSHQIVITGGEPLLYPDQVKAIFEVMPKHMEMTIETNGWLLEKLDLDDERLTLSISPKLTTTESTMESRLKLTEIVKRSYAERTKTRHILKFVMNDITPHIMTSMFHEFVEEVGLPSSNVYLMSEGVTADDIDDKQSIISEMALLAGWNYTDRLHLRLWKGKRNT